MPVVHHQSKLKTFLITTFSNVFNQVDSKLGFNRNLAALAIDLQYYLNPRIPTLSPENGLAPSLVSSVRSLVGKEKSSWLWLYPTVAVIHPR
jgi:hypothetical protein